jgi:outer membrane lipoprotein carrier protein
MQLISLAVVFLASAAAPNAASAPTPAPEAAVRAPVSVPVHAAVAAQDVDAVIKQAVTAWAKVSTLRATFEQTVTNPITGSKMLARGELQQRKPSRLAITFTDPVGDRIVADGKHVWVFLPSAAPGQVLKMTNAEAGASNTDLIGQFLTTPRSGYEVKDSGLDTVGNRPARALVLTAKPGQSLPFIRAKVWVDTRDYLIRQFESTDASGVSRHVRMLTMSPNVAVESAAFVFNVPAGARVIEP